MCRPWNTWDYPLPLDGEAATATSDDDDEENGEQTNAGSPVVEVSSDEEDTSPALPAFLAGFSSAQLQQLRALLEQTGPNMLPLPAVAVQAEPDPDPVAVNMDRTGDMLEGATSFRTPEPVQPACVRSSVCQLVSLYHGWLLQSMISIKQTRQPRGWTHCGKKRHQWSCLLSKLR